MADVSKYYALIPTGNSSFDQVLEQYLDLASDIHAGNPVDAAAYEDARTQLLNQAPSISLPPDKQSLLDELVALAPDIEPPNHNDDSDEGR